MDIKKFSLLTLAILLTSCSSSPISNQSSDKTSISTNSGNNIYETNRKLVVYSTVDDVENEKILYYWAEKYKVDITVKSLTSNEIDTFLEREKNNPIADIRFGDMNLKKLNQNRELYESYVAKNDEIFNQDFKNYTSFITNYKLMGNSLVVNTRLEENYKLNIQGYQDIIKEEISELVSIGSIAYSDRGFYQLANLLYVMGDGSYLDDKSWLFVENLIKNIKGNVVGPFYDVHIVVMSSEAIVGLTNEFYSSLLIEQGVRIVKNVYPKEGTAFQSFGASIIKDSKNIIIAQEFVDWLISDEGQNQVSLLGLRPVNDKITLKNKNLKNRSEIKTIYIDEVYLESIREEIIIRFENLISKYL